MPFQVANYYSYSLNLTFAQIFTDRFYLDRYTPCRVWLRVSRGFQSTTIFKIFYFSFLSIVITLSLKNAMLGYSQYFVSNDENFRHQVVELKGNENGEGKIFKNHFDFVIIFQVANYYSYSLNLTFAQIFIDRFYLDRHTPYRVWLRVPRGFQSTTIIVFQFPVYHDNFVTEKCYARLSLIFCQ